MGLTIFMRNEQNLLEKFGSEQANDFTECNSCNKRFLFFKKSDHPIPWRNSISRPIASVSSVAGGDH
jgi:hypothetical protein